MILPITYRVLHRSPFARVSDVRCRCGRCGRSAEETTAVHSIAIPRRGVFVKHVANQPIAGDANTVLFFHAGEPYRVSHPADAGDDCTSIALAEPLLRDALRALDPRAADAPDRPIPWSHGPLDADAFLSLLHLTRELPNIDPDEPAAADEAIFSLVSRILTGVAKAHGSTAPADRRTAATRRAHRDLIEATKAECARVPEGRVDLRQIAAAVHASPYHLSRLFHERVGCTISAYTRRLRARRAAAMIADGGFSLAQVASAAGFCDQSHLCRAMRDELGLSPRRAAADRATFATASKTLPPPAGRLIVEN